MEDQAISDIRDVPGGAYGEGKEMREIRLVQTCTHSRNPCAPMPGGMFDPREGQMSR